jgi:hypothetical protein
MQMPSSLAVAGSRQQDHRPCIGCRFGLPVRRYGVCERVRADRHGPQDTLFNEIKQSSSNLLEPRRIAEILADPDPANGQRSLEREL